MKSKDKKWKNSAVVKWHDGISLMTEQYSYTEWIDKNDNVVDKMLFDRQNDPDEDFNLATNPDKKGLLENLNKTLRSRRGSGFLTE
jgi:arylsulfatase A-like enzyme